MQHLVVGAGAVGIGIATALLRAGDGVTFVARGETARALRRHGCARSGIFGDARFAPDAFSLVAHADEVVAPPDTVIVATKTPASEAVARELARSDAIAAGGAEVVLTHNGLGSAEIFAARLSERRVWNARVITGFRRPEPWRVEITVHAGPVLLGSLFGEPPGRLAPLARALVRGGIPAETCADIGAWLWAKLLYSCALNPLGAILGVPYGELGRRATTRRVMERVVREIFDVLEAEGGRTRWPDADAYLAHFHRALLPPTAAHESSMLQDVRAGRRTEIESLCGEVVRRGARHGVPTPVNAALAELVRALEARRPGGR